MKKIIILLTCMMGLLFSACTDKDHRSSLNGGDLVVSYSVMDLGAEVKTKTTVPATDGEEVLKSLYLLFFDHTENGSGLYIGYYKVEGDLSMSSSISIPFTNSILQNDKSYKILAIANLDQASYITESVDTWISSTIEGRTEYQAILNTMIYVQGVGIDENDDSNAILPSEILMTGSTEKLASVKEVSLELTRGLVRFDVQNIRKDEFDLVSVSIWNAPVNTPAWTGEKYDVPARHYRYYGIKRERNINEEGYGDELPNITGGLYSFENFVSDPKVDDEVTTCLIVGIAPRFENNPNFKKEITYHRINVHPTDGGQNIKRNYVYKVSINTVNAEGEGSEYDAWSKGTNNLDLIINNWNLDENGMVLTDGKNTLVIPVKRVVLDPEGDEREYSIYTLGEGQVSITKRELPQEISVTLEGNRLLVKAEKMEQGEEERKGMIEITLNSLRGEINFVQSENVEEYLNINFTQLSAFPAIGMNSIPDGYLEVTSSGSWSAKIYNNSTGVNPGFSFKLNETVTELTSEGNYESNYVQIYTTGSNENLEARHSFVIFTLDNNPEINRSLVLTQRGATKLSITPPLSVFTFQPTGFPSSELTNVGEDIKGKYVYFNIEPGYKDETQLEYNAWKAELDNNNFELEIDNDPNTTSPQQIRIRAIRNEQGVSLNDILRISYSDGSNPIVIRITQAALGLNLINLGQDLAVIGGVHGGIRVEADASLTYNVQILSRTDDELANSNVQGGYLIGDNGEKIYNNTKITGRPIDQIIYVGFHKLLTPNVNISPEIKIRVSIDGLEGIEGMEKVFTITQKALTPKNVNALNTIYSSRGYIRSNGSYSYNQYYNQVLTQNTTIFGPSSSYLYMPNNFNIAEGNWGVNNTGTISSSITHINAHHVQGITGTTTPIINWLKDTEGVLVINDDYNTSASFQSGRLFNLLQYTRTSPSGDPKVNTSIADNKVYKYILGGDGPFGAANPSSFSHDGERLVLSGYPTTAVPLIIDNNGAQILIDPVNRVVFNGELQIFSSSTYNFSGTPSTDNHRFLANYIAFIHNVSMYGSHFTDHFLDETKTEAPYDYKK